MRYNEVIPLYKKYNVDKAIEIYKDDKSFVCEIFTKCRYLALSYEKNENGPVINEEYLEWIKLHFLIFLSHHRQNCFLLVR